MPLAAWLVRSSCAHYGIRTQGQATCSQTDRDPALSKIPCSQVDRGGQPPASWPWLYESVTPRVALRQKGVSFLSSTWTARVFGKVIGSEGTRPAPPPAVGVAFCPAAAAMLGSGGFQPLSSARKCRAAFGYETGRETSHWSVSTIPSAVLCAFYVERALVSVCHVPGVIPSARTEPRRPRAEFRGSQRRVPADRPGRAPAALG